MLSMLATDWRSAPSRIIVNDGAPDCLGRVRSANPQRSSLKSRAEICAPDEIRRLAAISGVARDAGTVRLRIVNGRI